VSGLNRTPISSSFASPKRCRSSHETPCARTRDSSDGDSVTRARTNHNVLDLRDPSNVPRSGEAAEITVPRVPSQAGSVPFLAQKGVFVLFRGRTHPDTVCMCVGSRFPWLWDSSILSHGSQGRAEIRYVEQKLHALQPRATDACA